MKAKTPIALAATVFAVALAHAQSTVLFRDDFTRANNNNINASTAGQSGSLSPLTWGITTVTGTAIINGNELRLDASDSNGNSGAYVYPDQNFIGLTSLTATMEIASGTSGGNGRATGFGIGYTKAELDGKTSVSNNNQWTGADVYIGFDNVGTTRNVFVREEGTNVFSKAIPSPAYPAKYSIVFTFADMNNGTTINYEVFENDISVHTDSTTWTGTDQNYIAFASNYTTNCDIDFISIEGEFPAAPSIVKDDNTDDLNLGTSWVGGTAPAAGETAKWDSTVTGANTTVLGADATWGSVVIEDPAGLVTIGSGNTLTLDSLDTLVDMSGATADLTVDANLAMTGSGVWDVATGRTLSVGGVVSGGSGLSKAGDGIAIISGTNTYTNGTNVAAGVLQLGASDVIPDTTDSGDVSVTGTLDLNGNSDTIWALTGAGIVDNAADSTTSTLTVGDFGKSGTFSGTLQNSGTSATLNIEKIGAGNLVLSGTNTYSGTTTVSGGSLQVGSLGALGNTSGVSLADGTEFVPDLDGFTTSVPFTLGAAATTSTISVPINGPGGGGEITMTLNGVISGDGDLVFTDLSGFGNNSDGIIVLGAASTYTGDTSIDTSGLLGNNTIIRSGIANALPATTMLSLEGAAGQGSGRFVTFDLNGNDQTLAGLQNVPQFDRKQRVTSTGAATLTVNNTNDFSFGVGGGGDGFAQIQGAISLAKSGVGTLTLSETQPYTGSTTITGGTLQGVVGGSIASSAVSLDSLGTYGVLVTDETESWTCDSLATTGAGTLEFDFGSVLPSASVSPMIITNAADFSAATPLVSVQVAAGLPLGTYPLATWGSLAGSAPTGAQLTISTLAPGTSADLSVTGNTLNLVISDTSLDVAKGDNIDDLNLGTSWASGTAPAAGDTAVWNNTVLGANSTSLGADLTWGTISILDPGGPVTILAGNTLTLIGEPSGILPLIDLSSATQDLTINADLIMTDFGFWDVAAGRTLTVTGAISGTFGPIKQGAGTAVISGANTYTGETSVDAGTLQLGASDVIPDGGAAGNVTVDGILDLNGFSETINRLSGTGVVDTVSGGSPTLTVGSNGQTGTFDGVLQNTAGTLNLEKIGVGTLTLNGANTFTGTTTLSDGTLSLGNVDALLTTTGLSLADGTLLQPTVSGAVINAPITIGATATTATISAPVINPGSQTPQLLTLNGAIGGDGNVTFTSSINSNTVNTVVLNAQSTYGGSTLMDTSGTSATQTFVRLGTDNALPTTTVLTIDGGVGEGSGRRIELDLNGFNQELAGLTNVTRTLRIQRIVNSDSNPTATLTLNNSSDYTYTGRLGNNGPNFGLTKSGSGVFNANGTLQYSGDTTVTAGTLSLGSANSGNDASTVTIADTGATLDLNFSGTDTVDQLFIGTTQLDAGEYKAVGSAATGTELAQLTGTGTLTVTTGPAGYATWATTNAGGQGPDLDFDNDGVQNGIEYFMNAAAGFTANPQLDGTNTITWPNGGNIAASEYGPTGQFVIQTSPDLSNWTNVDVGDLTTNTDGPGGELTYTLTGPGSRFVRLKVTPN